MLANGLPTLAIRYLRVLANYMQMLRLSCKCFGKSWRFQCEYCTFSPVEVARVNQNGIKAHTCPSPIYISSSAMVDAARQVATLALLFSHHADVTQVAVDALHNKYSYHSQRIHKKFATLIVK